MSKGNTKKPFNKKKLKYGGVATAITVFVIAIIVFINLIIGVLTERKGLKLDLTSQNYFEISQDTIDYIKNIDSDVEIAVMQKKDELEGLQQGKMVVETLAKYEHNSDRIKVEYYDITENPDVVNKYSANYNGDITTGNIVIACGDRVKVTSIISLFDYDSSSYYQTGQLSYTSFKGEQEITSAVMSVTDANPIKIAIVSMYNGEAIYALDLDYAIASFVSLLGKNGYEYTPVDILKDEISPEEYDMVILPAPTNDLTDDSIKKLEDFLYNNGNLDKNMIYISDVLQRKTPKIDEFLEVWGIKIGDSQVIESNEDNLQLINIARNTSGQATQAKAPVVSVSESEYSEMLSNTKLPIVAPASRDINLLFDANVDRTTTAILKTDSSAVLYPLNMQEEENVSLGDLKDEEATEETEETTEFDVDSAEKGERVVMALASKTNVDANDVTHTNNMLVIGGASFTDPCITGTSTFNNAEFIVNAVNKVCNKENSIFIAEKQFESTALDITSSQKNIISKIVIIAFPLIVVICGAVVLLRRRNR